MSSETVDLVLFEIAGVRYATELRAVRRISTVEFEQSVGYPLGRPAIGRRALVFHPTSAPYDEEAQLLIDAVLGVHTVPVDDEPPTTLFGLSVSADSVTDEARVTPSDAKSMVSPRVATSCAVVSSTGNVVAVNVALVAPASTVTVVGTLTAPGRELLRLAISATRSKGRLFIGSLPGGGMDHRCVADFD